MIGQETSERFPGNLGEQGNIMFIQGVGLGGGYRNEDNKAFEMKMKHLIS